MANYDVFNGDADGIFALIQLRKHTPLESIKITGVKRDIALLSCCDAQSGDIVTVLDVSMDKNFASLKALLAKEVKVFYADHHKASQKLEHKLLEAYINLDANTCTGLIVDDYLKGQFRPWAIAAAFGDNLIKPGELLCKRAGFTAKQRDFLCELGTLVNYNGYGEKLEDLHFSPKLLFDLLYCYESPFELQQDLSSPYFKLRKAYQEDMGKIENIKFHYCDSQLNVLILPNQAFSRRISGVFSNQLANVTPDKAHLVLSLNSDTSYAVSLRAPLNNKQGADRICSAFATGGGRAAAAGINKLPADLIEQLIRATSMFYQKSTIEK